MRPDAGSLKKRRPLETGKAKRKDRRGDSGTGTRERAEKTEHGETHGGDETTGDGRRRRNRREEEEADDGEGESRERWQVARGHRRGGTGKLMLLRDSKISLISV